MTDHLTRMTARSSADDGRTTADWYRIPGSPCWSCGLLLRTDSPVESGNLRVIPAGYRVRTRVQTSADLVAAAELSTPIAIACSASHERDRRHPTCLPVDASQVPRNPPSPSSAGSFRAHARLRHSPVHDRHGETVTSAPPVPHCGRPLLGVLPSRGRKERQHGEEH